MAKFWTVMGSPLNGVQFKFHPRGNEWNEGGHSLTAHKEGKEVGELHWGRQTGEVSQIRTRPFGFRKGLGTALWDRAHEIAAENPDTVTAPQHSPVQTEHGMGWSAKEESRNIPRPIQGQQAMFPHANTTGV
jgi:hypothetical protein